jgi:putative ABC transport system ATP-binding protein
MVTHELDIARYTKRTVVMRDGIIVGDERVANRLVAADELKKLDEERQAIKLTT